MIITIIVVTILIASIVFEIWNANNFRFDYSDILEGIATVNIILAGTIAVVIGFVSITNHINIDAHLEATNEKRAALVYQLENETYKNDNNLGASELFDKISDFNSKVVRGRGGMHNPWINWFYQPIWDDVELIKY